MKDVIIVAMNESTISRTLPHIHYTNPYAQQTIWFGIEFVVQIKILGSHIKVFFLN